MSERACLRGPTAWVQPLIGVVGVPIRDRQASPARSSPGSVGLDRSLERPVIPRRRIVPLLARARANGRRREGSAVVWLADGPIDASARSNGAFRRRMARWRPSRTAAEWASSASRPLRWRRIRRRPRWRQSGPCHRDRRRDPGRLRTCVHRHRHRHADPSHGFSRLRAARRRQGYLGWSGRGGRLAVAGQAGWAQPGRGPVGNERTRRQVAFLAQSREPGALAIRS